ncbi:hypothetical protein, partial [Luteimonas saliphila]|uniref:hypothetical protein n=1 Tax=Luteimonas saliphila TaxID=2804919 RepID=UPI001EE2684C
GLRLGAFRAGDCHSDRARSGRHSAPALTCTRSPMADSPPQRIHALLAAIPGPERPSEHHWPDFEEAGHPAIAGRQR